MHAIVMTQDNEHNLATPKKVAGVWVWSVRWFGWRGKAHPWNTAPYPYIGRIRQLEITPEQVDGQPGWEGIHSEICSTQSW